MPAPSPPPLALHVTLHWRHDAIAFRRLHGDGVAAVGAHPDALAPIPALPRSQPEAGIVTVNDPIRFSPE